MVLVKGQQSMVNGAQPKRTKQKMPKKALIFTLVAEQNWAKLKRHLNSAKASKSCKAKGESNINCLAMALGHQAPVHIIEKIIEIDDTLLTERDSFGATALHVACLNGTRYELIEVLHGHCPSLTQTLDYDHRAPLHHTIEFACQPDTAEEEYVNTVSLLCDSAPGMVHCSDHLGETPIDLVQYSKSRLSPSSSEHERLDKLYIKLKKLSINLYSELKRGWELEGFFKSSCKLISQQDQSQSLPSRSSTTGSSSLGASQAYHQTSENNSAWPDSFSLLTNESPNINFNNNTNLNVNTNDHNNLNATLNTNNPNNRNSAATATDAEGESENRPKRLKKFSWK